ncbi:MAG: TspO/MBR family protein [Candidatus Woesebacteria bacterium]|nr:TspO/MBR family protein [Candidatus Woesebacteria bacterium]
MRIKSISKLLISIIISQLAGLVGTFFTFSAIPTWYITLNKPIFNPPNYIFGPVWTILYTLIGISLYKIWIKKGSLKLFWVHLFLNTIWSPIFFGAKNLGVAFVVIILMWISLIFLIKNFYKIDKSASYLLIPYLLWISFASFLNFSILILNP